MGRSKSVWRILGDGDAVGVCVSPGGAGREPRRQRREERGSHIDGTRLRAARRGEPDDSGGLLERSEAVSQRLGDRVIQFGRTRFPVAEKLTSVRAFPSFRRAGRKPPAFSHDGGRSVARPKTQRRQALWRQGTW